MSASGSTELGLRAFRAAMLSGEVEEQQAFEQVMQQIAPVFEDDGLFSPDLRGALVVVSPDAGSATATRFWASAIRTGLGVASPAAFPWCLANAPCAALSRRFGLIGPNATWLADFGERPAASLHAPLAWWQAACSGGEMSAERGLWMVALVCGGPRAALAAWHWTPGPGAVASGHQWTDAAAQRMASDWTAELGGTNDPPA